MSSNTQYSVDDKSMQWLMTRIGAAADSHSKHFHRDQHILVEYDWVEEASRRENILTACDKMVEEWEKQGVDLTSIKDRETHSLVMSWLNGIAYDLVHVVESEIET